LILLGNALGAHLSTVLPLLHRGTYAFLGVVVVAIIAGIVIIRARSRPLRAKSL
jgi:hypothetical protein